jgi:hypothetical protein
MTFIEIEEAPIDEELEAISQNNPTAKCSWCGEIIRLDGHELALAMCQGCYDRMLQEFLREQQLKQAPSHASDR